MSTTVVRYTTKPEQGDENQALVEAVFAQLADEAPAGLRYVTFRLEDGVSFVHVATVETNDDINPLTSISAFADFQRGIPERFEESPLVMNATVVGSYGMESPV